MPAVYQMPWRVSLFGAYLRMSTKDKGLTDGADIILTCGGCGQLFEVKADEKEEGRIRWKAEGWKAKGEKQACPDCLIAVLPLGQVQTELRYPRTDRFASAWRRMMLWKRLDRLVANG